MLEIFPVTCIFISVYLYGWSNSNVHSSISPLGLFQGIICNIHGVNLFFFYRGVEIFEKSQKGDQDFLVKIGGCSPYSEVVYRKGGKHCFSLVIYGFCSSNALYPVFHLECLLLLSHNMRLFGMLVFIIRIIWVLSNIWLMFIWIVNGWLLISWQSLSVEKQFLSLTF